LAEPGLKSTAEAELLLNECNEEFGSQETRNREIGFLEGSWLLGWEIKRRITTKVSPLYFFLVS